jgi:hypothetical protein
MGFGSFLKKAINPLTPFKAIGSAVKGDMKGAFLQSATMGLAGGGHRPGVPGAPPPPVSAEAQNYFNTLSEGDRNQIQAGSVGNGGIESWYQGAKAAGAVGAPSPLPGAATGMLNMGVKPAAVAEPAAPQESYKDMIARQKAQQAARAGGAKFTRGNMPAPAPAAGVAPPQMGGGPGGGGAWSQALGAAAGRLTA